MRRLGRSRWRCAATALLLVMVLTWVPLARASGGGSLVRRYPLGTQTLCCRAGSAKPGAGATRTAATAGRTRVHDKSNRHHGGTSVLLVVVIAVVAFAPVAFIFRAGFSVRGRTARDDPLPEAVGGSLSDVEPAADEGVLTHRVTREAATRPSSAPEAVSPNGGVSSTSDQTQVLDLAGVAGDSSSKMPATRSAIRPDVPDELRHRLSDDVMAALLAGASTEEEIIRPRGLLNQLTRRLVETAMEAEITDHLGYERRQEPPNGTANARNGSASKRLITEHGEVLVDTPRDRDGSFSPKIVKKRQRRFVGFDDAILAVYSRGLSTRDIEVRIADIYGGHVDRDLISRVTSAVANDARAWQQRPLDDVYPVVFLDALALKIRAGDSVQSRAGYLAVGVGTDGSRDVLGMWRLETEDANFWMQALSELRQRGVRDIVICCADGLRGLPEAVEAVFPRTTVQACI